MSHIKRKTPQACDSCGRKFNPPKNGWECPHCGYDNKVGIEPHKEIP